MIIAVNITLDIGLLMDEFRRFASETHKLMRETAQGWAGGLASAGQEIVSRRLGRTSLAKPVGNTVRARCPPRAGRDPRITVGCIPPGVPRHPGDTTGLRPRGGLRNSQGLQGASSTFLL